MGVYIKGMDMPENCQECECLNVEHFFCQVSGRAPKDENMVKRRPEWCQLVEVPTPHGRLIDADTFENFIRKEWDKNDHWIADVAYSRPTIIHAEGNEDGSGQT